MRAEPGVAPVGVNRDREGSDCSFLSQAAPPSSVGADPPPHQPSPRLGFFDSPSRGSENILTHACCRRDRPLCLSASNTLAKDNHGGQNNLDELSLRKSQDIWNHGLICTPADCASLRRPPPLRKKTGGGRNREGGAITCCFDSLLYGFLKNQTYFEPFLILAFLEKDLSFFQIGILIGFREVCINIFEIPSGAVADLYGRRRSMIFSFSRLHRLFPRLWLFDLLRRLVHRHVRLRPGRFVPHRDAQGDDLRMAQDSGQRRRAHPGLRVHALVVEDGLGRLGRRRERVHFHRRAL